MDLVIFEQNKPLVLRALSRGEFDYIEAASEYVETEFFGFIQARSLLEDLARTYPSPRKKQEVPVWLYIASDLSMRLHGIDAFHAFPMVVRAGGMINAFAKKLGQKAIHPDTGEVTLLCEGFNRKNHYDRQTPCDQDFLRKMARDTDAQDLLRWYNRDVARLLRDRRAFDPEGLFIGDGSYLFVPDNPAYEGSVRLRFDEDGHPISRQEYEEMASQAQARCQWRRCYKMVTLLHTTRRLDRFLFAGVRVVSGKDHECPILYEMVEDFVGAVGPGIMKLLIVDRGFLDGWAIARCKKEHRIDVLVPVRRGMDIHADAIALFARPETEWVSCPQPLPQSPLPLRPRPEAVERREQKRQERLKQRGPQKPPVAPERVVLEREAAVIGGFTSWSACTVPLSVIANREHYADGHVETWLLLDTRRIKDPRTSQQDYQLRTAMEERYRQLKCFSNLARFTSRALSLVVNQVVFVLLAYTLLQIFLLRKGRRELNKNALPRFRRQLLPSENRLIVCWRIYYALFDPYEYTDLILSLRPAAQREIAEKSRRMSRLFQEGLANPRAP